MARIWFPIAFILIYYHISGLSTTNILRLTHPNSRPVLASRCTCDSCNASLTVIEQLPILSYILCKGRCRHCGCAIPLFPLIMEIVIWSSMSLLTAVCGFSVVGVTLSFLFYELTRIAVVARLGKRKTAFAKQYLLAVIAMIPFYGMTVFVAALYSVIP